MIGLIVYGNVLVLLLPVVNWASRRLVGVRVCSERALWVCYTIGCGALGIVGFLDGWWAGVVLNAGCMIIGLHMVKIHWDDDDDDWPGPRKLADWVKRKLARRPVPAPVKR